MSFAKAVKSYSWIIFPSIFLTIIILRWFYYGKESFFTSATVGLAIAILTSLYNNVSYFRKPFIFVYFFLSRISFEWEINATIKGDESSISQIDQLKIRAMITEILKKTGYSSRIKDIVVSFGTKVEEKYVAYVPVYGINLIFDYYPDPDFTDDGENKSILKIKGQTLLPYRETKKLLNQFLKHFFSELENSITEKNYINYSVKVFSSDKDKSFFEDQFIKNISNVDHFSISKQNADYKIIINKNYLEINSQLREDLITYASNFLLRLR
jgi:hypothetical protein